MSQPHQMQQLLKQVLHFQLQQQLEWFLQLEFLLQKKMSLLQLKGRHIKIYLKYSF